MKLVNQYIIPFKGLKEGEHEFEFEFGKEFFDKHEVLEAKSGNVKATILMLKRANLITLDIYLSGFIEIQCDRCLEYFNYDIDYSGNLVVKFSESESTTDDEIWVLHPNEHQLELEQYFFECIGLSLPLQKVHPNTKKGNASCDAEMLKILNAHTSGIITEEETDTDPRWSKLKNLLNDTNLN